MVSYFLIMGSNFVLDSHPNGSVNFYLGNRLKFKGFKIVILGHFDLASLLAIVIPWFPSLGRVLLICGLILLIDIWFALVNRNQFCKIMYILCFLK